SLSWAVAGPAGCPGRKPRTSGGPRPPAGYGGGRRLSCAPALILAGSSTGIAAVGVPPGCWYAGSAFARRLGALVGLHQAVHEQVRGRRGAGGAAAHAELGVAVGDVPLDGADAQHQRGGDLAVAA